MNLLVQYLKAINDWKIVTSYWFILMVCCVCGLGKRSRLFVIWCMTHNLVPIFIMGIINRSVLSHGLIADVDFQSTATHSKVLFIQRTALKLLLLINFQRLWLRYWHQRIAFWKYYSYLQCTALFKVLLERTVARMNALINVLLIWYQSTAWVLFKVLLCLNGYTSRA